MDFFLGVTFLGRSTRCLVERFFTALGAVATFFCVMRFFTGAVFAAVLVFVTTFFLVKVCVTGAFFATEALLVVTFFPVAACVVAGRFFTTAVFLLTDRFLTTALLTGACFVGAIFFVATFLLGERVFTAAFFTAICVWSVCPPDSCRVVFFLVVRLVAATFFVKLPTRLVAVFFTIIIIPPSRIYTALSAEYNKAFLKSQNIRLYPYR
ncbi:MAG: hypothetical protein KDI27_08220 [Gammaproteobacteria bacterium]|nr:hypothetical protein [Gammaproteobacteria bacterium]